MTKPEAVRSEGFGGGLVEWHGCGKASKFTPTRCAERESGRAKGRVREEAEKIRRKGGGERPRALARGVRQIAGDRGGIGAGVERLGETFCVGLLVDCSARCLFVADDLTWAGFAGEGAGEHGRGVLSQGDRPN